MISTKRLIDANILKTLFDVRYDTAFIQERTRDNKERWNGYCTGINWGRNTIADAPTVDAVEVVHGRWITWKELFPNRFALLSLEKNKGFCSYCGAFRKKENYCPNCGAKMDGGNEDG